MYAGKPLHHVWKEHMNHNLELHRKLELCLRLGSYLEDILNLYPEDYVLPGAIICRPAIAVGRCLKAKLYSACRVKEFSSEIQSLADITCLPELC